MLTFFLFICALPVLITLFLIGLRFFQELLPVLVVVVIAGGCMVIGGSLIGPIPTNTSDTISTVLGMMLAFAFLGGFAVLVVAAIWDIIKRVRSRSKQQATH